MNSPRPGRPGLKYDDLANAANELVASGENPTYRKLRERLGTGSMGSIRRHLTRWRASRPRIKSSSPFAIRPGDIANLEPIDFAALINRLVRVETKRNGILAEPDTTLRINDPDGGIDGAVSWIGGPARTVRLPARDVAWQAKSGNRFKPNELAKEIQQPGGHALKRRVAEVLQRGGAYVLFSAADTTPEKKSAALQGLLDAARRFLPGDTPPNIAVVSGDAIAAWANEDLWAKTFLISVAGRDHPALLLTYDEWQRQPGLTNAYVWSEGALEIADALRAHIETKGSAYRLDGAPGLGKTRLVVEALRSVDKNGHGVVYFNARYPGTAVDLLRAFPTWKRLGVGGIIVVDDCDLALHQQITQLIAGSEMSAITIDYNRQSGADATLRPLKDDVIERIVVAHPMSPGSADQRRIVEYAQGWPLMAILVLRALADGKEHIGNLDDDQLTERLVGRNPDPDGNRILRLLALFNHVGCSDDAESEWETLRSSFTPDVPRDKFFRSVQSFVRRGLIVRIGRYWRVTPPPLAIRLAREWLEDAPPEHQERLFRDLPPSLTESLARRFSEISTPTAIDLADRLLRTGGRFGELRGIVGRSNSSMVRALAEVNPRAAVDALRRVLVPLSDRDLLNIDEREGRQTLVFALEYIAFHQDCFKDAVRVLSILARNENGRNANNSTGTFTKFFSVVGSQTEAPPDYRIEIIDELLTSDDEASLKLAALALRRALSIDYGYVMLGPESQGGRPPLVEWRAAIWKEIFDYYDKSLDRTLQLSARSAAAFADARGIVADAVPVLARYRRWESLHRAISHLLDGAWPKAVERLKWTIRHELKDADESDQDHAKSLLALLAPATIEERTKLFVTNPPLDLENRNGAIVDVRLEQVEKFASDTIASHDVRRVLEIISSGFHELSYDYGLTVARQVANLEGLSEEAMLAYSTAHGRPNDLALMGVVRAVADRMPRLRRSILDKISTDDRMISALPAVSTQPRVEAEDARRLIDAYLSGRLSEQPRPFVLSGRAYADIDERTVRDLATIFVDRGWHSSAVELLTYGVDGESRFDDIFSRIVLESKFIFEEMPGLHDWNVFEVIRRIVRAGDSAFAAAVAKDMMDLAISDLGFSAKRRPSELWPDLLIVGDVWDALLKRYSQLDTHGRWKLLINMVYIGQAETEHRLALEAVALDDLLVFAEQYPADVPWFLANHGRLIEVREDDTLEVTTLMKALLSKFGDRDDVLGNVDANLHSFLSVGSRAPYYEKRMKLVEMIPTFGNTKVAAWKERLRSGLEAQRRRATVDDEEFQEGIY